MNLIALLQTPVHKKEWLDVIKNNPHYLIELLNISLKNDFDFSWKATWVLNLHSKQITPYLTNQAIETYLQNFSTAKDSQQREVLKLISSLTLNEINLLLWFDACLCLWQNIQKKSATRYTAYNFLLQVIKKYPELKNELHLYQNNYYLHKLSPGIKSIIINKIT